MGLHYIELNASEGRMEGGKEGRREGRKEIGKEGRREGMKEGIGFNSIPFNQSIPGVLYSLVIHLTRGRKADV